MRYVLGLYCANVQGRYTSGAHAMRARACYDRAQGDLLLFVIMRLVMFFLIGTGAVRRFSAADYFYLSWLVGWFVARSQSRWLVGWLYLSALNV